MSRTARKMKTFDCIKSKRQAQRRLYEVTRDMTADERRAHVHQLVRSGPLADFWKKVMRSARTAPKAGRL